MSPKSKPTIAQDSEAFSDTLTVAAAIACRLHISGHISEVYYHQLCAQLNGSIYTLMFALPPGTLPLERLESGERLILVTKMAPA